MRISEIRSGASPSSYPPASKHFQGSSYESEFIYLSGPRLQHTTSLTCRQVLNSAPLSNSEHLPVAFALLVRQYGSTPERKWRWRRGCHDTALFDQNQAIALAMRISPTHPAAILGVIVRDPRAPPSRPVRAVWKPGSCDSPSSRSSRAVSRLSPPHVGAAPETAGRTTSAAALAGRFRTAHHTRQRRDRCGALSSRGGRALAAAASESAARKKLSLRMKNYHRAWAWS